MKSKFMHATASLVVFAGLSLVLVGLASRSHSRPSLSAEQEHAHEREADASAPEPEGDHDHDDPVSGKRLDLDDLRKIECEHGAPIITCDECRYEVGVAKIDPALAQGLVETQRLSARAHATKTLQLTGEIQLDLTRVVEIASVGSGRVEVISKILGDAVKAAETLAVIQSPELAQAQANFLEARAKLDLARQTYERENRLYEQKISSQADFLVARSELPAAQAALAIVRKRLELFGLSDAQVETLAKTDPGSRFGQLVLTTPMAGTVIKQHIVRGQLVNPTETLYRIADLSRVWIACDVYESDLPALHDRVTSAESLGAQIYVSAFPNTPFEGTVEMIGSQLDHETRTLGVRLAADNPQGKLKPGMFVTVLIDLDDAETILRVPETAVLSDAGQQFVFARLDDELWIRRDVSIGPAESGMVEVRAGLVTGDVIATKGAFMFKSEVLKEKMGAGCAH